MCKFKIDKNWVLRKNSKNTKKSLKLSPKIQGSDIHPLKVVTITQKTSKQKGAIIRRAYVWCVNDK